MTTWFEEAGLGMFIHWDHASQQGLEISWPLVGGTTGSIMPHCQAVAVDDYHASATTFDPKAWEPRAVARLAKAAGMRYVILTTKHHSGYAMFHTKHSDFGVANSPYGADIVRGYADALREEDLRVGFYFSLSDWSHPDYPAFREEDKPYTGRPPRPSPDAWTRFTEAMFGEIRELLTNYEQVDVLWFDGGWERSADEWRATELESMIRELQPEILINDRLPGSNADYTTPEQFVPAQPPDGRWETCMTMNESWGYNPTDPDYKSATQLIHTLCEVAGKGGNFLLNVSPRGDGTLPPEQIERIEAVGAWMQRHGEAIHGTQPGLEPWQFYGPSTRNGDRIYLHLLSKPYGEVTVRGVKVKRIERVTALADGRELAFTTRTGIIESFAPDPDGELRIEVPDDVPDEHATVIAVDVRPA